MMMKKIAGGIFLLFLVLASVWIVFGRGGAKLQTSEGAIFGTTYHIKYESSENLDTAIFAELKRVDASLSVFNPQSTISRVNNRQTSRADAMLYDVLQKAQEVSVATDGAFDVTVMPLVNAWGFGFKSRQFPTGAQIDSIEKFVGYNLIKLSTDSTITCADVRLMIDCGAIAKGYGVDRVAKLLREHGVLNYMVEIGGEVVTKGRNPETQSPWQIGISKPVEGADAKNGELQTVLSLENAALATSGNYRNYYEHNGRKYAHTIDPRTGRPVQHSLLSATVIAPDCATADAYATAFMVLGVDGAKKVLKEKKRLHAYLIYADENGMLKSLEL